MAGAAGNSPVVAIADDYLAVVRDEINPAIRRYRDFLQQTYLPAAREALGVSANPGGRACYDAVVRQYGTVAMPANEVVACAQATRNRALAAMPRAFGVYTRVPVKIEPYPEFRAKAGAPGQAPSFMIGNLTLSLLRQLVEEWIAGARGGAGGDRG